MSMRTRRHSAIFVAGLLFLSLALFVPAGTTGCGQGFLKRSPAKPGVQKSGKKNPEVAAATATAPAPGETSGPGTAAPTTSAAPRVDESVTKMPAPVPPPSPHEPKLQVAQAKLAAGNLAESEAALAGLVEVSRELTPAEAQRLLALQQDLGKLRKKIQDEADARELSEIRSALAQDRWAESLPLLEKIMDRDLSPKNNEQAEKLRGEAFRSQVRHEELVAAVAELGADSDPARRAARQRLWQDPDRAAPLLRAALTQDRPQTVGPALLFLRDLPGPEPLLPPVLAILARPEQSACWPEVMGLLPSIRERGAGPELLRLALETQHADQRHMALQALSRVPDPPRETLTKLLPLLENPGPDLVPALEAATRAILVHHLEDWEGLKGFPEVDDRTQAQVRALVQRVPGWISAAATEEKQAPLAAAARRLAILWRLQPAQPLAGVQLLAASGQIGYRLAQAVLDGVWNSDQGNSMWLHADNAQSWLVLDLGRECTVSGVRIWNYNSANEPHRGWQDAVCWVGSDPGSWNSPVEFTIPKAPARATPADYGVTINLPLLRGRYLKLQSRRLWDGGGHGGLTEVSVLGE